MEKNDNYILEYMVAGLVVIAGLFIFFTVRNQDLDAARSTFIGLLKGRQAVEQAIDWKSLQAIGVDAGATYSGLPDDKERANYRKAFIASVAAGFKQAGAKPEAFKNWRVYQKEQNKVIIAADYKNKIILLTFSKYGRNKLSAIQWKE